MEKDDFLAQVEKAYDAKSMEPENVFMFKLFDFQFSYDDENKQCTITCPVTEVMHNPASILHGGIATYIADTAMGHLNFRLKDAPYVSLDLNTSFLKAVSEGTLYATARYLKDGYKVCFMECIIKDEADDIIAKTTGTFYRYEK